jgi:hypothetical protein
MSFYQPRRAYFQDAVSLTRADRHLTREELQTIAPSTYQEEAHNSRSDRYGHVSTREVIRALWAEGFAPFGVQQARVRTEDKAGFQKHMIKFRRRDDALSKGEAQRVGEVRAEVVLVNSHDGSSSFQLYAGLFRLVCLNGMVVGENVQSVRVPHSVRAVAGVIDATQTLAQQAVEVFPLIDAMKARDLTRVERLELAEEALALRHGVGESPISPELALRPIRHGDVGTDLYTTYNVLQEKLIRGGDRVVIKTEAGHLRRQTTRAVTGIDGNVQLNRALWDAAASRLAA